MRFDSEVLIVGAGFSGTMVAAHLARRGVSSVLVDPAERSARGAAYGTLDPRHRLNVKAGNMSAWPDAPGHFADHVAETRGEAPEFAARTHYGDYLAAQLAEAVASGHARVVRARAVSARPAPDGGWFVGLDDGRSLVARRLVLATGNPPPGPLAALAEIHPDDLIDQPWGAEGGTRLHRAAVNGEPVLIVGTSLTMVDVVLSLAAKKHPGPIVAVSRRGLLPRAHATPGEPKLPAPTLAELPTRASAMLAWLRARAKGEGEWRLAIDRLRPLTQAYWTGLDAAEQRRFLRHARAWWDVHRHRIAPDIAAEVEAMTASGRLRVLAGRIVRADDSADGRYAVTIDRREGGRETVEAGLIVNCTGPLSALRDQRDPLIEQMLADGLLAADGLGIGVEVGAGDRLEGHDDAFAIGPMTRGTYWEVTAVPDLRVKAAELAETIADSLG